MVALLSRSQVEHSPYEHLSAVADRWDKAASALDEKFQMGSEALAKIPWTGAPADAERARLEQDLAKVRDTSPAGPLKYEQDADDLGATIPGTAAVSVVTEENLGHRVTPRSMAKVTPWRVSARMKDHCRPARHNCRTVLNTLATVS